MQDKDNFKNLIKKNLKICNKIYACDTGEAFMQKEDTMVSNNVVFSEFIELIPKLKAYGVDIPMDVILQQLKNLIEAYEYNDAMLLADTLKYEINDSLQLYIEIMEQLKKENIVI